MLKQTGMTRYSPRYLEFVEKHLIPFKNHSTLNR